MPFALLHTFRSDVRGGGIVGARAWVARITGPDPKYGFQRVFVHKEPRLSGSGRSGHIEFEIYEPGLYEFRGIGSSAASIASQSHTGGLSGFIIVHADGVVESVDRATALNMAAEMTAQEGKE